MQQPPRAKRPRAAEYDLPQEGGVEQLGDGETQGGQDRGKRRERNKIHARASRERKKRSFEALQQRCCYLDQLLVCLKIAIIKLAPQELSASIFRASNAAMSGKTLMDAIPQMSAAALQSQVGLNIDAFIICTLITYMGVGN
jgi:hypothetical protein